VGELQHAEAERQDRKPGQFSDGVHWNAQGTDTLAAAVMTLDTLLRNAATAVVQQL
jgi:lysophospholipase L1-like esterase